MNDYDRLIEKIKQGIKEAHQDNAKIFKSIIEFETLLKSDRSRKIVSNFEPIEKLIKAANNSRFEDEELEAAVEDVETWMAYSKPLLEKIHDAYWAMYANLNLIMVNDWQDINAQAVRELTSTFLKHDPQILRLMMLEEKQGNVTLSHPDKPNLVIIATTEALIDVRWQKVQELSGSKDVTRMRKAEAADWLKYHESQLVDALLYDYKYETATPSSAIFWLDQDTHNVWYDDPAFGPVVRVDHLAYNSELGVHISPEYQDKYNTD